jgi:secreted PhoX family phosphatase
VDRRSFLRSTALAAGVTALGPSFWQRAYAATAQPGVGPYGPLLEADANGVMLPQGFTSRILAVTGQPVRGTSFVWHPAPDGGAVFPQADGSWVYTSNSEVPLVGGASAIRFGADGEIADAYRILSGTSLNCAGGPSPWGTWLSCEENPNGQVFECDVTRSSQGVVLPALGRFQHEAVAFDDGRGQLYLTEDRSDGRFYRFTPTAYPDLSAGALEVLATDDAGAVTWIPVRSQTQPQQLAGRPEGSRAFSGGEGVWFDSDHVYFTTKGDNRVYDLDVAAQRLTVLYDAASLGEDAPLTGVDNLVVSQSADIFVAEDGGNLEIVLITPDQVVAPVMRLVGHDRSEICGPAFSPDGSRLYFSSQRGTDGRGVTFEVRGPFRTARTGPPARGTGVLPPAGAGTNDGDESTGGDVPGPTQSPQPAPGGGSGDGGSGDSTGGTGSTSVQSGSRLAATGGPEALTAAAAVVTAGAAAAALAGRRAAGDGAPAED